MGVDPRPIFNMMHEANYGETIPDGEKPHYRIIQMAKIKTKDWETTICLQKKNQNWNWKTKQRKRGANILDERQLKENIKNLK